ncbi:MAG: prolipoprotein diacylglyceryl transferase [Chloroflexota bacterium]|nr:prolipoprotein diacylglyceryl transferase [Dehalococcoidia bacterium]MDW8253533.1 prolipoprotein diacylglyceryl transferase [Chloroflexota bacterium]
MIEINIDPTMVTLGPFAITWHGFFSAVGLFIGVWVAARLAPSVGLTADDIYNGAPWAVVGGIIGARLFHVVDRWDYYAQNPLQILMITEGGIAIYGAVVGGVIAGYLYARFAKLPVPWFADAAAVGLILGQGIGRIGDIINGEHWGRPADVPWAVVYTHPQTLGQIGVPVHLAVGYEMVLDFALFGLLLALWRKLPGGVIFWLYIALYSVIRLVTSFYRIDTAPWLFGLTQQQVLGILGIALGFPLAFWTYQRGKGAPLPEPKSAATSAPASAEAAGGPTSSPPLG